MLAAYRYRNNQICLSFQSKLKKYKKKNDKRELNIRSWYMTAEEIDLLLISFIMTNIFIFIFTLRNVLTSSLLDASLSFLNFRFSSPTNLWLWSRVNNKKKKHTWASYPRHDHFSPLVGTSVPLSLFAH